MYSSRQAMRAFNLLATKYGNSELRLADFFLQQFKDWGYNSAHGPPDVSPVGHAANAHLDLAIANFGIQEMTHLNDATYEVFPGAPTFKNGYMYVNEAPGFGVDIDEELAVKFPVPGGAGNWLPVRRNDGSAVRP